MRTKRKIAKWLQAFMLMGCIAIAFSACKKDKDSKDNGLRVNPTWETPSEDGHEMENPKMWVFNAETGSLVAVNAYNTVAELASQNFDLPGGKYKILVTTNLTAPFYIRQATRGEIPSDTGLGNIVIGLEDDKLIKNNAYFGMNEIIINEDGGRMVIESPMKGVLSNVNLIINGLPTDTEVKLHFNNTALNFYPTRKNQDGEYGVTGDEIKQTDLDTFINHNINFETGDIYLMPIIQNDKNTLIQLDIIRLDNNYNKVETEYDLIAPAMKPGGKYEIKLNYPDLLPSRPTMHLEKTKIDDWTEGWVYKGEILNPEEKKK